MKKNHLQRYNLTQILATSYSRPSLTPGLIMSNPFLKSLFYIDVN